MTEGSHFKLPHLPGAMDLYDCHDLIWSSIRDLFPSGILISSSSSFFHFGIMWGRVDVASGVASWTSWLTNQGGQCCRSDSCSTQKGPWRYQGPMRWIKRLLSLFGRMMFCESWWKKHQTDIVWRFMSFSYVIVGSFAWSRWKSL